MANGQLILVLEHFRRLFRAPASAATSDGQLLEEFAAHRDQASLAQLVERHGPMVWGVCRRLLADANDAEDAFQGTFLVLARKVAAIRRRESVGSWLYGVAYRVASRIRVAASRRRAHERQAMIATQADPAAEAAWRELRPLLDEELVRLPEKYRAPLVLCYLEGKTREEAARHLSWPEGTVAGRLARGRDLLRDRLVRRGIALGGTTLASFLAQQVGQGAVPATLAQGTVDNICHLVDGGAAGMSATAAAAAQGVLRAMFLTRVTLTASLLLTIGLLGGLGWWAFRSDAAPLDSAANSAKPEGQGKTDPPGVPLELKLVAKKDTYTLDLGGKTPAEYRKQLRNRGYPPAPAVELLLELHNTGDKEITVRYQKAYIPATLHLKGPGAVSAANPIARPSDQGFPPPTDESKLEPGQKLELTIKALDYGRDSQRVYWTEAGEYALTASINLTVSPAPAKARDAGNGFGHVTVTSTPVKLKVQEKK
jgi:RNA polymerase sigma factor (sigma-70 family)